MVDSSDSRDPLDRMAEEFVARYRAGERPSLTGYIKRMPDRAEEVRELFPALVELNSAACHRRNARPKLSSAPVGVMSFASYTDFRTARSRPGASKVRGPV